ERRAGILRYIGDDAAARGAQCGGIGAQDLDVADHDPAGSDLSAAPTMAKQSEPHRGLARARFAHRAQNLAGSDLEVDLLDDGKGRAGKPDAQALDDDRSSGHGALRPMPIAARAIPSVMRFMPTVSRPIAATGSSTGQGWIAMPMRFSLIISPQSAAGGCRPNPMKLTAAMGPVEQVSRKPDSTSSGADSIASPSRPT